MSWESQMPALFHHGSVESQVDRLLDDAIQAVSEWSESWDPTCNIFEDSDGFTVQMALPGIEPSHIDVQVEHNALRVKGERKSETEERRVCYVSNCRQAAFDARGQVFA
jgi:HSP20 family protein